jgi:hypothetical protein
LRLHRLSLIGSGGGVILNPLTLSSQSIPEHSTAGVVIGAIGNKTALSTLSLTNDAGGRFALSGTNIVTGATQTDYATATSHSITIRETLAGAINTPLDTTITISVTTTVGFTTPVLTLTSVTGTNPPVWSSVMADLQVGDTVELDFTSDGSAPDGTRRRNSYSCY